MHPAQNLNPSTLASSLSDPSLANHLQDNVDGLKRSQSLQFSSLGETSADEEMDHYENLVPKAKPKEKAKRKGPTTRKSRKTVKTDPDCSD